MRNLHLIYSDGIRTLSLFENATDRAIDFSGMKAQRTRFEDHDAQYVHDGPTTLLAWREHGLAFTLVGDLELKELARSPPPSSRKRRSALAARPPRFAWGPGPTSQQH